MTSYANFMSLLATKIIALSFHTSGFTLEFWLNFLKTHLLHLIKLKYNVIPLNMLCYINFPLNMYCMQNHIPWCLSVTSFFYLWNERNVHWILIKSTVRNQQNGNRSNKGETKVSFPICTGYCNKEISYSIEEKVLVDLKGLSFILFSPFFFALHYIFAS